MPNKRNPKSRKKHKQATAGTFQKEPRVVLPKPITVINPEFYRDQEKPREGLASYGSKTLNLPPDFND